MKGKVYRRGINPSIHQARAAAKDLISSGASKHGVLLISLPRHRIGLGRRGGGGDIRDPSVEKKIRITPFFVHPLSYTIRYLSVCRQIYLNIKNVTPYTSKRVCTRGEGEKEREETSIAPINAHANCTCTHTVARNALIFRDEFTVVTIRYRVMRNIFRKPAYRHLKARPPSLKIICSPSIQLSWA